MQRKIGTFVGQSEKRKMRASEQYTRVGELSRRLENILEELQSIREDLLSLQEEALEGAKAEVDSESTTAVVAPASLTAKEEVHSEEEQEEPCILDDEVTELPEAYQMGEDEEVSTPDAPQATFEIGPQERAGAATMNELFRPKSGTAEDLEQLFEKSTKHFDLTHGVALADQYLFIRELFQNDSEAYWSALEEIGKMSSWNQVEHYLTHILKLSPEDPAAERFIEVVKESGR